MDTALPARRTGRRWLTGGVAAAAVAATAVVVITDPFGGSGAPPAPTYTTSTATVVRRSLTSQTQVDATLGYDRTYSVVNQLSGLATTLPGIGRVVRQGQVLYRVGGRPVVLLYGRVPAYRDLSYGTKGTDVAQLNKALGAGTSTYFGSGTRDAVERLQDRLGVTETGRLPLGQAVFLPGAARITAVGGGTVLGGPVHPGAVVLTATSDTPVVTVNLDPSLQNEIKAGDKVTIALPGNRTSPGRVASVGRVAAKQPGATASTVTVKVTPTDHAATTGLDQASVTVSIVTGSVKDALVVPVSALMAQPHGYAVEVADPAGPRLVAVTPGLFDDADGLVQVTGSGLAAGQRVVVPTS
jgi:hypothetical protein